MGVDISNSLLVGASYEELEEWIESKAEEGDGVQDVIDEYFVTASPYYDSDRQDWFLGFKIQNYQPISEEWLDVVKETAHQFELLTGVKPRIRGGAHVW